MSKRSEHTFQFGAAVIAKAAEDEAKYHEDRLAYWQAEYDQAISVVEDTIGARVVRRDVTGGQQVDVVVDYGNPDAWAQAQRAYRKIENHRLDAERYRSDAEVYGTQNGRVYELDTDDVHHFRLHGGPRED